MQVNFILSNLRLFVSKTTGGTAKLPRTLSEQTVLLIQRNEVGWAQGTKVVLIGSSSVNQMRNFALGFSSCFSS